MNREQNRLVTKMIQGKIFPVMELLEIRKKEFQDEITRLEEREKFCDERHTFLSENDISYMMSDTFKFAKEARKIRGIIPYKINRLKKFSQRINEMS